MTRHRQVPVCRTGWRRRLPAQVSGNGPASGQVYLGSTLCADGMRRVLTPMIVSAGHCQRPPSKRPIARDQAPYVNRAIAALGRRSSRSSHASRSVPHQQPDSASWPKATYIRHGCRALGSIFADRLEKTLTHPIPPGAAGRRAVGGPERPP
jgi:hypothetical protein